MNSLDRLCVYHTANTGRQTITHTHIHTFGQFKGCLFILGDKVKQSANRNPEQEENMETPHSRGDLMVITVAVLHHCPLSIFLLCEIKQGLLSALLKFVDLRHFYQ